MKSISKRALSLYALVLLFLAGVGLLYFNLVINSNDWAMNRANKHLYSDGALSTAGDILDSDGNILVTTQDGKRVYSDNKNVRMALLHTIGDTNGYISNGIQTSFEDELTGYTLKDGVYNLKRYGKGNDIKLTLNSKVCETAYKALGKNKGTVGVINYKTGEIICIVSPKVQPFADVCNHRFTMASADFLSFVVTNGLHTLFLSADKTSLGTTRHFLSIYLPHLLQLIPSSYWTLTCIAALSLTIA